MQEWTSCEGTAIKMQHWTGIPLALHPASKSAIGPYISIPLICHATLSREHTIIIGYFSVAKVFQVVAVMLVVDSCVN